MKCQNCGKNNANVRYTEVINGKKVELFLCDVCAEKMNIGLDFDFGMNDIFSSFFDEVSDIKYFPKQEVEKCDKCGLTYSEFSKSGMLGCEACYDTFSNRLDNVLAKIHGANRHIGKFDEKVSKIEEVDKLKDELKKCIDNEEYEKAAVLRDKIKKLER